MDTINYILSKKKSLFISILLIIAATLLMFRIGNRTLWMDEMAALEYIHKAPLTFFVDYFKYPENHPPLYYFLVLACYYFFPYGELGVRLLSVLASLGIVIAVYKFSMKVFSENLYKYIAALMIIISPFFILIGQMARYHSVTALFALSALYFFWKIVWKEGVRNDYWLFTFFAVLVGFTDYPHFIYLELIVNAYVLYIFFKKTDVINLKSWIYSQIIIVASFIPMIVLLYNRIVFQGDGGFNKENLLGNGVIHYLTAFFMHFYDFFIGENTLPWNWFVFIPMCLILIIAVINLFLKWKNYLTQREKDVIVLTVICVLLNIVFMNYANPRYNFIVIPKYGFLAFPLSIVALTICIKHLPKKLKLLSLIVYMASCIYGLTNFYQAKNYLNASYFNTFGTFNYVEKNSQIGDGLILNGQTNRAAYEFYKDKYFSKLKAVSLNEVDINPLETNRYWYFSANGDGDSVDPAVIDYIPSGFIVIDRFDDVPVDPTLKKYKEKVLGYSSYTYKYSVFLLKQSELN